MTATNSFTVGLDAVCEKIAQGISYIAQQFGIALDWSTENILPYITELFTRFCKWEVATSTAWIVIMCSVTVLFLIISIILFCIGERYNDDLVFVSYAGFVFTAILFVVTLFVVGTQVFDILEMQNVPEKAILEYINKIIVKVKYSS